MTVRLNPYLSFRDTAEAAMEFYRSVFGGELAITRFGDIPMPGVGPELTGKVMHAMLTIDDGMFLMAADVPPSMEIASANHPISLSGDDDALLRGWWGALSEGATVQWPLELAPWGDSFGQLVDRFGVAWLINIAGAAA